MERTGGGGDRPSARPDRRGRPRPAATLPTAYALGGMIETVPDAALSCAATRRWRRWRATRAAVADLLTELWCRGTYGSLPPEASLGHRTAGRRSTVGMIRATGRKACRTSPPVAASKSTKSQEDGMIKDQRGFTRIAPPPRSTWRITSRSTLSRWSGKSSARHARRGLPRSSRVSAAARRDAPPTYIAMGHLLFKLGGNVSIGLRAARRGDQGDIPNYTKIPADRHPGEPSRNCPRPRAGRGPLRPASAVGARPGERASASPPESRPSRPVATSYWRF